MQQDVGLSFLGGGHYLALAPMDRAGGLEGEHLPPAQAGKEPAQFLGAVPDPTLTVLGYKRSIFVDGTGACAHPTKGPCI